MLRLEHYIYERLQKLQGIPKVYGFTTEGNYNILAIELLGKSLDALVCERGTLSVPTVLVIAEQMVKLYITIG